MWAIEGGHDAACGRKGEVALEKKVAAEVKEPA